jgi:hypothetical protein
MTAARTGGARRGWAGTIRRRGSAATDSQGRPLQPRGTYEQPAVAVEQAVDDDLVCIKSAYLPYRKPDRPDVTGDSDVQATPEATQTTSEVTQATPM